jgi:hypothetical protein
MRLRIYILATSFDEKLDKRRACPGREGVR